MVRRRLLLVLLALAGVASAAGPPSAHAGNYQIRSCFSDRAFRTGAFASSATKGMRIRRACSQRWQSMRGLYAGNVVRNGTVARNSGATLVLTAPPGTQFVSLAWSGGTRRTDCRYDIDIYARGPAGKRSLRRAVPGRDCPPKGRAQLSTQGKPRAGSGDRPSGIRGMNQIVLRTVCRSQPGERCSTRRANYAGIKVSEATVEDVTKPSVRITGGDLVSGAWVSGPRSLTYEAADNVGISSGFLSIGGVTGTAKARVCDAAFPVPCPSGPDELRQNTARYSEGTQQISANAIDAAGNVGTSTPALARIDNTPPLAVPTTADGGENWRSTNAFGVNWINPAEGDRAPIDAATYRLCRAGGNCEDAKTQAGENLSQLAGLEVPAPGEWTLRMWRRDQAGNSTEASASSPVIFRYDPEAPKVAFDPLAVGDPTLVTAPVSDPLSGVIAGQVEISREGSGSWQGLPTKLTGDRLQARIDDATMPAGRYLLRASADDRAGNRGTGDKRTDGSVAVVNLPLRLEARLSGGFRSHKTVRRVRKRGHKRRVVRRRIATIRPNLRVRRGRLATLAGRLRMADKQPLTGAAVYVFEQRPGGAERYLGTASTNSRGGYRFRVRALANAGYRLVYLGAPSVRPATRTVSLSVPGQTTFHVKRRRLVNGQAVRFKGRLAVAPAGLAAGKLVELQTKLSGRWQTFRTVRSDARGRWASSYRFRRTRGLVRYAFRVRLPAEAGYPFASGATPRIRVTVRGR
jgi:hypothetical protein